MPLFIYITMKHWLLYSNDIYGHLCAAIAATWIKQNPKDSISWWPNLSTGIKTPLLVPNRDIKKSDTMWYLAQTPTQRGMIDTKSEIKPKKVYWYDYRYGNYLHIMEDPESNGIESYAGYRSTLPDIASRMWGDLFPGIRLPRIISYIERFLRGEDDGVAADAYFGLELVETDPRILDTYDDVSGDMWNNLLKEISEDDFTNLTDAERMERLQWDATMQLVNMGSIIRTYIQLKTQKLIDADKLKTHHLPNGERCLLVNADQLDLNTLRTYYTATGSAFPYVGYYYVSGSSKLDYNVHIVKLQSATEDALTVAKGYRDWYGDADTAFFKTDAIEFEVHHFKQ